MPFHFNTTAVTLLGMLAVSSAPAESKEQFDARMQWWRDAKYGMFLHWGPVSQVGKELSWSRAGAKPLDITGSPAGAGEDPIYDNLYKTFNPTAYDAKQWVKIAKAAEMKYMVLTCKHHDGFALWPSKVSNYTIAQSPFQRDIVKELADACHEAGMKFGVYYSPRDWHQPDYGIGDNQKYLDYMNAQVRELLTGYGKVDIIWWDSYGKGDLVNFWKIGTTHDLARSLQPGIVMNNRLAVLGDYNQQPEPYRGDFDTPEQTVGRMQTDRPWESCITLVGHQWSYKPDGEMMDAKEVLQTLITCTTGDGNLLLNVGPMPTGAIEPRQVEVLKTAGDWLAKYGESVYHTRGGPLHNSGWGGTTYQSNKVYVHILRWTDTSLRLRPIEEKIISSRALTGGEVKVEQTEHGISITVAEKDRNPLDTVIELTLDRPVTKVYPGRADTSIFEGPGCGELISADATFEASSSSPGNDNPASHPSLFTGKNEGYAFHTLNESNPWIIVDLGAVQNVKGVRISNRPGDNRANGLELLISKDKTSWTPVWKAEHFEDVWDVPVTQLVAGAQVPGVTARYLKLQLTGDRERPLLLKQVEVFGGKH